MEVRGRLIAREVTGRFGRVAALDCGHVKLVITEHPPFNLKPSFFSCLGLDPWRADYVVLKSLFHFRPFYLLLNRKSLLVRTRGATDLDLVTRIRSHDPVVPCQDVDDWRPADRRRRGVVSQ